MKFGLVLFACVLAAASAQFNTQYNRNDQNNNPFGFYNRNKYNQNGQYNRYNNNNRYNPFQQFTTRAPYRPFTVTTPAPSVYSTYAPTTVAPFTFAPVSFAPSTAAPVKVNPASVVPVARVSSDARTAETVRFGNENSPDGSYNYFYETSNGIAAQAQGTPRNFGGDPPLAPVVSQGSFSWTSPEGVPILVTYNADENGYQPSGDVLPTPPALPPQIARALEYTARLYKSSPQ